jgi:hypothetical protein
MAKKPSVCLEETINIEMVDPDEVAHEHNVDFTMGGNDQVYAKFVPKGEIWVADNQSKEGAVTTLIHEFTERTLMKHYGMTYNDAHAISLACESVVRSSLRKGIPASLKADLPPGSDEIAKAIIPPRKGRK